MSEYVSARKAEEEKALRERRKYNITVGIVVACVVLILVFVILFGSNLFYNGVSALNVGGEKYTVADFNYYYASVYNSYYSSITSAYGTGSGVVGTLLPDNTKSFRDQTYFGSDDGSTWADYFEETAIERMKSVTAVCAAAEAEGYQLPQEERDEMEESIASLTSTVIAGGYSDLDAYLTVMYGKGVTEKVFRRNVEKEYLAQSFSLYKNDSFTFTADEIAANYAEKADDYDYYSYRLYSFSGAAVTDDEETEEDETMSAEDAAAKAKADADAYLAAATDEQAFIDYAASLQDSEDYDADAATIRHTQGTGLTSAIKDWMIDPARKAGDTAVLKTADDATTQYYYVVYFLERDNNRYNAVSGYYGLVTPDSGDEEASEDVLREKAVQQAQEVKADYDALSEKGYDAFAALMDESTDLLTGGSSPLTQIGRYGLPDELTDWFMDESRTEGDVDVVYVDGYGAFVLYYSGVDGVYGDLISENDLRSEAYEQWDTDTLANYQDVDKGILMGLSKKITALGG